MNYSRDEKSTFYLDLRKAYDTLDHKLLLIELEAYDVRGNCLKWLETLLSGRIQRVEVNGAFSILSLFFIIYIIYLPLCKSVKSLFADNINLTASGCQITNIREDIDNLDSWLHANKLVINIDITI